MYAFRRPVYLWIPQKTYRKEIKSKGVSPI